MKRTKAWAILAVLLIAAAAGGGYYYWFGRTTLLAVNIEPIRQRDLQSVVSASGKIEPKRQIDISANQMGRVTRLAVEEGQRVTAGQFLLEIDPRSLAGQIQRGEAGVAAARSGLEQARTMIEQARATLDLARQQLRRQDELWKEGLTTRENLERAQNEVKVREADLAAREQDTKTREQQIRQEEAGLETTRYNLSQIIISAPMNGIVTRRNIEEGETAVVGTMNNPGTVLLTIADMSVIEAEVEVDETDIPTVSLGQEATVTIDAVPERTFRGRVTEIGNSPIQAATNQGQQQTATNFKVVITLDEAPEDIRPGFTCTAEIVTGTRAQALAVPIQSLTVREMLFNSAGELIHEPPPSRNRDASMEPTVSAQEPPAGHVRRETEGVFVVREGRAVFVPIKVGIAGDRFFEVLSGLRPRDEVITGPFESVRQLLDGERVAVKNSETKR